MPSSKKRINLTIPDVIYEKLQAYKETNGITNDAGACLQLISQQLKAQEQAQILQKAFMMLSAEQVAELSVEGARSMKRLLEQKTGE